MRLTEEYLISKGFVKTEPKGNFKTNEFILGDPKGNADNVTIVYLFSVPEVYFGIKDYFVRSQKLFEDLCVKHGVKLC